MGRGYILILFLIAPLADAGLKKCKDAKGSGICKSLVNKAEKACKKYEKKQEGTAAQLAALQSQSFDRSTDTAAMAANYAQIQQLAAQDAKNQKECQKKLKGYKEECDERCDEKPDGETCKEGKEEIDKLRKLCKKLEESAAHMASWAGENAGLIGGAGAPTDNNNKNNGSGTTNSEPTAKPTTITGYQNVNSPDEIDDMAVDDDDGSSFAGRGLGGGGAGGAAAGAAGGGAGGGLGGGATAGAGGGAADAGEGGLGDNALGGGSANRTLANGGNGGNAGTEFDTSGLGGAATRVGGQGNGTGTEGASSNGNTVHLPGYMLWGAPARKNRIEMRYRALLEGARSSATAAPTATPAKPAAAAPVSVKPTNVNNPK